MKLEPRVLTSQQITYEPLVSGSVYNPTYITSMQIERLGSRVIRSSNSPDTSINFNLYSYSYIDSLTNANILHSALTCEHPEDYRPWLASHDSILDRYTNLGRHQKVYAANLTGSRFVRVDLGSAISSTSGWISEFWYKADASAGVHQLFVLEHDTGVWNPDVLAYYVAGDTTLYVSLNSGGVLLEFANAAPTDYDNHHYRLMRSKIGTDWHYNLYIDSVRSGDTVDNTALFTFTHAEGGTNGYVAEWRIWATDTGIFDAALSNFYWNAYYASGSVPTGSTLNLVSYLTSYNLSESQRFLVNRGVATQIWYNYDLGGHEFPTLPFCNTEQLAVISISGTTTTTTTLGLGIATQLRAIELPTLAARCLSSISWPLTRNGTICDLQIANGCLLLRYNSSDSDFAVVGHVTRDTIVLDDDVVFGELELSDLDDLIPTLERRMQTLYLEFDYLAAANGTLRPEAYDWSDVNKFRTTLPISDVVAYDESFDKPMLNMALTEDIAKTVAQQLRLRAAIDI